MARALDSAHGLEPAASRPRMAGGPKGSGRAGPSRLSEPNVNSCVCGFRGRAAWRRPRPRSERCRPQRARSVCVSAPRPRRPAPGATRRRRPDWRLPRRSRFATPNAPRPAARTTFLRHVGRGAGLSLEALSTAPTIALLRRLALADGTRLLTRPDGCTRCNRNSPGRAPSTTGTLPLQSVGALPTFMV